MGAHIFIRLEANPYQTLTLSHRLISTLNLIACPQLVELNKYCVSGYSRLTLVSRRGRRHTRENIIATRSVMNSTDLFVLSDPERKAHKCVRCASDVSNQGVPAGDDLALEVVDLRTTTFGQAEVEPRTFA